MTTPPIFLNPIGSIHKQELGQNVLVLDPSYATGLEGLKHFGHALVFWWCHKQKEEPRRRKLLYAPPFLYKPWGVFSTRTPYRPNPIALSVVEVNGLDLVKGEVLISEIDADDQSLLLDIKPYLPAFDRVRNTHVPQWAASLGDFLPAGGFVYK